MALKHTFVGLDYWRLADEFSVIDASFLILGEDPGNFSLVDQTSPLTSNIRKEAGYTEEDDTFQNSDGSLYLVPANFRAVFKALRNAILSNKLKAKLVNVGREPEYSKGYDEGYDRIEPDDGEENRHYGFALSKGVPTVFSNADSILNTSGSLEDRTLYVLKEPDWTQTTIELEDLKRWFNMRGVAPVFFFPDGVAEGFRDLSHPRYSAKLATAVAAWEAVRSPAKKKSAKQTLTDWIIGNGVRFELSNEEGVVSPSVAEEVAKVANWRTSGGANPTNLELDEPDAGEFEAIQNFEEVPPKTDENPYSNEKVDGLDSDLPF
jgi:hypothetical protein